MELDTHADNSYDADKDIHTRCLRLCLPLLRRRGLDGLTVSFKGKAA